jgi:hypothetical protein
VEKNTLRNIVFAFILGIVLGGGTTFGYYSGLLRNERSIYNDTLGALAESRRVAEDYRGQLDSARRASGELIEELGSALPEITRIAGERERAIAAVRVLRRVFDQLRKEYDEDY